MTRNTLDSFATHLHRSMRSVLNLRFACLSSSTRTTLCCGSQGTMSSSRGKAPFHVVQTGSKGIRLPKAINYPQHSLLTTPNLIHRNRHTDQPPGLLFDRFPDRQAERLPTTVYIRQQTAQAPVKQRERILERLETKLTTNLIISFNTVNFPSISSTIT
jgi:hypothetical protein